MQLKLLLKIAGFYGNSYPFVKALYNLNFTKGEILTQDTM